MIKPNIIKSGFKLAGLNLLFVLACAVPVSAENISNKLKAAYVANTLKFLHCPARDSEYINLCIQEQSDIFIQVKSLDNFKLGDGKRLRVFSQVVSAADCDSVYWDTQTLAGRTNNSEWQAVVEISDISSLEKSMDVTLFVQDNRLRFYIDKEFNLKNDCKLSSKLMRLSSQVPPE